jgi:hypothetical protein
MLDKDFDEDYLNWVHQSGLPPLTRTQWKFAQWLLEEENVKIISQIGGLDDIFISVRQYVKTHEYANLKKKNV